MIRAKRTAWLIPVEAALLKPSPWGCPYLHAVTEPYATYSTLVAAGVNAPRAVSVDSGSPSARDADTPTVVGVLLRDRYANP